MNDKRRSSEDISSLFATFGGDVGRYQEFDNAPTAEQGPNWTLLQQLGADPRAVPPPAPVTASAQVAAVGDLTTQTPPQTRTAAAATQAPSQNLTQTFAPDAAFSAEPVFAPEPSAPPSAAVPPPVAQPVTTLLPAQAPAAHPAPARPAHAEVAPALPADEPVTRAQPTTASAPPSVGTPLAALFERLARAPDPAAPSQHSLMAHWRQSG